MLKRYPEHQRRRPLLDESTVGRSSPTWTVLEIVVGADFLCDGAPDRQGMRGVDASHYTGLSSKNLSE